MITKNQLTRMKADAAASSSAFLKLKDNADKYLTNLDGNKSSAQNPALMYLLTGDAKYATTAYNWAKQYMAATLSSDSYLQFGDLMRGVALTLNWANGGLNETQKTELANYLHASANELWFANKGSQWGISDTQWQFAGNNYRMAFIEGTAYVGYALKSIGDARGQAWVDLANDKITRSRGVLEYVDTMQQGGDWLEGTNYGERSKQRLYRAFAVIAAAGGTNYFTKSPFFASSLVYAIYSSQPDNKVIYPAGDLGRSSGNEMNPFTREYVHLATYWLCDSQARKLGQHVLTKVIPSYDDTPRSFDQPSLRYMDVLYPTSVAVLDPATLPPSYKAGGTNWVTARASWDPHATSLTIMGAPIIHQSHQHFDTGSFLLYKDQWLLVDPETYGGYGFWRGEDHQGLYVPQRGLAFDDNLRSPGVTHFVDKTAAVYTQVDATMTYRYRNSSTDSSVPLLNEYTREIVYVRPDSVFVFDRVDAKAGSTGYYQNFHFAVAPTPAGDVYTVNNKGATLAFAELLGGASSVKQDSDRGNAPSQAYRIEEAATGAVSRFLNVMKTGSGTPPAIAPKAFGAAGSMRGAVVDTTAVAFSDLPKGAMPSLPITFTIPGTAATTLIMVNMSGMFTVTTAKGSDTQVTISAGSQVTADADGFAVVTL